MRLFVISLSLLFMVCAENVQARIGETLIELQARNGAGKEVGDQHLFTVGEFDLTVYFEDGRSVMEVFAPRVLVEGEVKAMEPHQIDHLLQSEGEGKSWVKMKSEEKASLWGRADGAVFARFDPTSNTLTFRPQGALPPRGSSTEKRRQEEKTTKTVGDSKSSALKTR